MPYKRAKETKKREAYNLEEARLRPLIIKTLRKKGFIVTRVEGFKDFADLWVFHIQGRLGAWVELKKPKGKQSEGQKKFEEMCLLNSVPYIILRSVEDAENIFNIADEIIEKFI